MVVLTHERSKVSGGVTPPGTNQTLSVYHNITNVNYPQRVCINCTDVTPDVRKTRDQQEVRVVHNSIIMFGYIKTINKQNKTVVRKPNFNSCETKSATQEEATPLFNTLSPTAIKPPALSYLAAAVRKTKGEGSSLVGVGLFPPTSLMCICYVAALRSGAGTCLEFLADQQRLKGSRPSRGQLTSDQLDKRFRGS